MEFIFALLFFIQSGESIYDQASLEFVLWHFIFDCVLTFNWCFQPNMIPRKKRLKKSFYNFIFFIINRDFYVINFECIIHSSSINCNVIVNWMLHVSDFFRSFMVSFKYDQILLRYYSNDSFYFYHHYFHIQYNSCFKSF